jgi:hypothetical protein
MPYNNRLPHGDLNIHFPAVSHIHAARRTGSIATRHRTIPSRVMFRGAQQIHPPTTLHQSATQSKIRPRLSDLVVTQPCRPYSATQPDALPRVCSRSPTPMPWRSVAFAARNIRVKRNAGLLQTRLQKHDFIQPALADCRRLVGSATLSPPVYLVALDTLYNRHDNTGSHAQPL